MTEIPEYLKGVVLQDCCTHHCRDWRETKGGKYPASDHSPGCSNFNLVKFHRLKISGNWLIDTPKNIKSIVKSFNDNFEDVDYSVEDVFLTQDQFEKLPEFEGF